MDEGFIICVLAIVKISALTLFGEWKQLRII